MELIPWYSLSERQVIDGDFFGRPDWCVSHFNHKCLAHYSEIEGQEGFHTCPFGFTSLVKKIGTTKVIYTSAVVRGHSDLKKVRPKIRDNDQKVHSESGFNEVVLKSIDYNTQIYREREENVRLSTLLRNLSAQFEEHNKLTFEALHEVRSLNKTLKSQSEDVLQTISKYVLNDRDDFYGFRIRNIHATSHILTTRLQAYDLLTNPSAFAKSPLKPVVVHHKFHKTKQILSTYFNESKVKINSEGTSYSEVSGNDLFELIPYLSLENFIKYTAPGTEITLNFGEDHTHVTVEMSGLGPRVEPEEITRLFEKNVRGKHAIKTNLPGGGVGLYLAKIICDMFGYEISAKSDSIVHSTIQGIPYTRFTMVLRCKISRKVNAS